MKTLEWWPQQSNAVLDVGDRTLTAGETFQVNNDEVEEALANPEIRLVHEAASSDASDTSETHSPGRAQRETPPT